MQDSPTNPSMVCDKTYEIEATEAQPRKRQRVANACDECRSRKIKCDGLHPVCGPCSRRRGPTSGCNWGVRQIHRTSTVKDELAQLKRRLKELEKGARSESQSSSTPASTSPVRINGNGQNLLGSNEVDGENNFVTALDCDASHPLTASDNSSLSSLTNQIRRILTSKSSTSCVSNSTHQDTPTAPASVKQTTLPPRHRAEHFFSIYWRLVDTLFPVLEEAEIELRYERLRTGEDSSQDHRPFLCTLNVIFGTASLLDTSVKPEMRQQEANIFYQRARGLLDFELINRQSTVQVQLFLILGYYLLISNEPQQCWMFVGFALRTAQSLGLDCDSVPEDGLSGPEEDSYRKLWHACVLLDRMVSMTLGRLPMISTQAAAAVPKPLAHAMDTVCECNSSQPSERENNGIDLHPYVVSLELHELLNEALVVSYGLPQQKPAEDDHFTLFFGSLGSQAISDILDVDKRMLLLSRRVPRHLRCDSTRPKTPTEHRLSNYTWLAYRNIRLLLFRPVLSRFCSAQNIKGSTLQDDLPWRLAHQCSVSCVQSALETVEFYDTVMAGKEMGVAEEFLPPWWYNICYIYTAAMVLVAARLHPAIVNDVTETIILNGSNLAIVLLKRFECFSHYANTCRIMAETLYKEASQYCQHRGQYGLEEQSYSSTTGSMHTVLRNLSRLPSTKQTQDIMEFPTLQETTLSNPTCLRSFQQTNTQPDYSLSVSDFAGAQQLLFDNFPVGLDNNQSALVTCSSSNLSIDTPARQDGPYNMSWFLNEPSGVFIG